MKKAREILRLSQNQTKNHLIFREVPRFHRSGRWADFGSGPAAKTQDADSVMSENSQVHRFNSF
jgi:hypothetical protein